MRPGYIALVFWVLSACAVYGILKSLRTGVATSTFTYRADENPVMFMMVILGRTCVIGLAIAETLYAFGLIRDPIAALRSIMLFHYAPW
jgi:hypothetical protein